MIDGQLELREHCLRKSDSLVPDDVHWLHTRHHHIEIVVINIVDIRHAGYLYTQVAIVYHAVYYQLCSQ